MRILTFVAIAAAVVAACGETTAPGAISDEQFIGAMVAMREAALAAGADEAAFVAARDQILANQSLTSDDLAAYIAAHNADPDHLAEVWEEVARRLPELQAH